MSDRVIASSISATQGDAVSLAAGDTLLVLNGVSVSANDGGSSGIFATGDAPGNSITVLGAVSGFYGILSSVKNSTITVGQSGSVTGGQTALSVSDGLNLRNYGTISGANGVQVAAGTQHLTIYNAGTIAATNGLAIQGASAGNVVINDGTIDGRIVLGIGNDLYYGRSGSVHYTDPAGKYSNMVLLLGGNDIAYGGSGYELFVGGAGNDTIDGGGGNDIADYSGAFADYMITHNQDGSITVADKQGDRDGTDTLTHVRFARFTDHTEVLINSSPSSVSLTSATVVENTAVNTAVANLLSHDADGDAVTYSLVPNGDNFFRLDGNKLILAQALDYDTQAHQHTIIVKATDPYGGETNAILTLSVANLIETTAVKRVGTAGADVLTGERGNDRLYGYDGNDTLVGSSGNDYMKGLNGNDRLWGGLGRDVLYGGSGKDVFVFDTKPNKKTNLDKIADFNVKDDTIWLDNKVFTKLGRGTEKHPGKLNAKFFTIGDHAKDKYDYVIYDNKKGVLYYDDDGSGRHKAVEIAILRKGLKMTYHDFMVI